ncbi:MAG: hypothetical protein Q9213_001173 [Squamulea squamosa]
MRAFAYRVTPIDVHLTEFGPDHEKKEAFETWFENMDMVLAASIRNFCIDEFVEFNWKPSGPVPERPSEREERLEREAIFRVRDECTSLAALEEWDIELPEFQELITEIDDWDIRWLKFIPDKDDHRMDAVDGELLWFYLRGQTGSKGVGLGKEWIRRFVDAYCGRRWDRDTEDRVQDLKTVEHEEGEGSLPEWLGL